MHYCVCLLDVPSSCTSTQLEIWTCFQPLVWHVQSITLECSTVAFNHLVCFLTMGMGDGLDDACCCTFSFIQWEMEMGKCLGDAQRLLATPFHSSTESGFFPAEVRAMIA